MPVERGLRLFKQLSSLTLTFTLNVASPPDPMPRLSPATRINVVPPLIGGVQENPDPCVDVVVILDFGIVNDRPPGVITSKLGVLKNLLLIMLF